jgi:subtilisin family serine protease
MAGRIAHFCQYLIIIKTPVMAKAKKIIDPVPSVIYAQASPISRGGSSMFAVLSSSAKGAVSRSVKAGNINSFFSSQGITDKAVAQLRKAGFKILQVSKTSINISGSPQTFRKALGANIVVESRKVIKSQRKKEYAQFLETDNYSIPGFIATQGTQFEDTLEGIAIEEPRYFMAASMFAPTKSYWHLRVPGDVSLGCNADKAHRAGITGKGIKVAMVDSGWYRHPYFEGRGYHANPVTLGPGATFPLKDESGHGTAESANIFAIAPDIDFYPVKMNGVNTVGAFNAAAALRPDIITCSWGSDRQLPGEVSAADIALAAAVSAAVASGITVIFSAGNGHWGFPGQHPDVISAGGVFLSQDSSLKASNYASGFASNIYPGRKVPDVCGLVGMLPKAVYIMLPLEAGDEIDQMNGVAAFPNGDETTRTDGWAAISGTSAAAPQLAGVCALIKQAKPTATPAQIKAILMRTAKDVILGTGSPNTGGHAARTGFDLATGCGLVDAYAAVRLARPYGSMTNSTISISAEVLLKHAGKKMKAADIRSSNVEKLFPAPSVAGEAIEQFKALGFTTTPLVGVSFSISAIKTHFEKVFGVKIMSTTNGGMAAATGKNSARAMLPLQHLPAALQALIESVVFPPAPDFGPNSY